MTVLPDYVYESETTRLVIEDRQKYRILQDWDRVPSCFETDVKYATYEFRIHTLCILAALTCFPSEHVYCLLFLRTEMKLRILALIFKLICSKNTGLWFVV